MYEATCTGIVDITIVSEKLLPGRENERKTLHWIKFLNSPVIDFSSPIHFHPPPPLKTATVIFSCSRRRENNKHSVLDKQKTVFLLNNNYNDILPRAEMGKQLTGEETEVRFIDKYWLTDWLGWDNEAAIIITFLEGAFLRLFFFHCPPPGCLLKFKKQKKRVAVKNTRYRLSPVQVARGRSGS